MINLNAAFRKWFGDSKVVDADGNPLVVYHGTQHEILSFSTECVPGRATSGDPLMDCLGAHFTDDRKVAEGFAGGWYRKKQTGKPRVYAVYLRLEQPYAVHEDELRQQLEDLAYTLDLSVEDDPVQIVAEFKEGLLNEGYDGIVYENTNEGGTSYIAFEPGQIKAIDNEGTWDYDKPEIRRNPMNVFPPLERVLQALSKKEYVMGVGRVTLHEALGGEPPVRAYLRRHAVTGFSAHDYWLRGWVVPYVAPNGELLLFRGYFLSSSGTRLLSEAFDPKDVMILEVGA